jgi:PhnB protein
MAKHNLFEQLDSLIDVILSRPRGPMPRVRGSLAGFARVFPPLLDLPSPDFREKLKSELKRRAHMSSKAAPVVASQQTATVHLCVHDAAAAIEFYKKAFGAVEVLRLNGPGPKIGHAEIRVGNSLISLADEFPDYGVRSPKSFGGSPVSVKLLVDDVDAFALRAVAAGAAVVRPVEDQFYGERTGTFSDPFGYEWKLSTRKEDLTEVEMQRRMEAMMKEGDEAPSDSSSGSRVNFIRKGFRTATPYLIARDAAGLIDFVKRTFGAEELFRDTGSAGGVHSEVRLGDSMLMIGGGAPGLSWKGESQPMAFHVYVKDCDAAFQRAIEAGANTLQPVKDQPYGERSGSAIDQAGNFWYIATARGASYKHSGLPDVQPYMHPLRAQPVMDFMAKAFGAVQTGWYADHAGVVHHAMFNIGDAAFEMGEAQGPYQPMPGMYYLYVPNADALYRRALEAGAKSDQEPTDLPYGDRVGNVTDPFGNQWCIATHVKDVTP